MDQEFLLQQIEELKKSVWVASQRCSTLEGKVSTLENKVSSLENRVTALEH